MMRSHAEADMTIVDGEDTMIAEATQRGGQLMGIDLAHMTIATKSGQITAAGGVTEAGVLSKTGGGVQTC